MLWKVKLHGCGSICDAWSMSYAILRHSPLESLIIPSIFHSDATRKSFAKSVNEAIEQARAGGVHGADSDTSKFDTGEDSDDWLNIDEDMLDGMLKGRTEPAHIGASQPPGVNAEEEINSAQAERLQNLAGKVEAFVEGEGGLEGAKFDE